MESVISFVTFHKDYNLSLVKLTNEAVSQLKQIMVDQNLSISGSCARLDLKDMSGGNLSFSLSVGDKFDNNSDNISLQEGVKIVYKKELSEYLSEVTVDYKDEGDKKGFVLHSVQNMSLDAFDF